MLFKKVIKEDKMSSLEREKMKESGEAIFQYLENQLKQKYSIMEYSERKLTFLSLRIINNNYRQTTTISAQELFESIQEEMKSPDEVEFDEEIIINFVEDLFEK